MTFALFFLLLVVTTEKNWAFSFQQVYTPSLTKIPYHLKNTQSSSIKRITSQQSSKITSTLQAKTTTGDNKETNNSKESTPHNNDPLYTLPPTTSSNDVVANTGILFVDPFSDFHSQYMIDRTLNLYQSGVVKVISPYQATGLNRTSTTDEDYMKYIAPLDEESLAIWLDKIPFSITGVICESDSGLEYSEQLSVSIAKIYNNKTFKHNGYDISRRDKFAMNKVCEEKGGCKTVKQFLCKSIDEALSNAATLGCTDDIQTSKPIVIKPKRGVASDRVVLCQTLVDVPSATDDIMNSFVFGELDAQHDSVLTQEYFAGKEYAVDMVSKKGHHKTAAVWYYEKTSTYDGSRPFAYLSTRLAAPDDTNIDKIISYVQNCLDALGIQWGMTHTEVKIDENDDGENNNNIRLIEVNVRQHNDHFGPICDACIGYNAMDMCLSAYLDDNNDESLFKSVPDQPLTLYHHGTIVNLACFVEGTIQEICHLQDIERLESVVAMELFPSFTVGEIVQPTKDIRSDCGWVHLIHEDRNILERDYQQICDWMKTMFRVSVK